tara:strand:+ start:1741 stop:2604 length:864 start_codon:yes stop_codon:yes gene_type:complete
MACVDKNPGILDLIAIKLKLLNNLSLNQLNGLDILLSIYNKSSQKYSFRVLFDRIIELAKKTDDPIKSVIYLTEAFKVVLDLMPQLKQLMTPKALRTISQMLLHRGPTDKFSATLGVFHCLKTILDDLARFGLEGKRFAIMVEVSDFADSRFVDILFYALEPDEIPSKIRSIVPEKVIRSVEVKWYTAASDVDAQHLQLLIDAERSVRRGRRMEDITWMVPKDYPQSKVDDLISLVDRNLEHFLRDSIPEYSSTEIASITEEVAINLYSQVFQKADSLRFFIDGIVQ